MASDLETDNDLVAGNSVNVKVSATFVNSYGLLRCTPAVSEHSRLRPDACQVLHHASDGAMTTFKPVPTASGILPIVTSTSGSLSLIASYGFSHVPYTTAFNAPAPNPNPSSTTPSGGATTDPPNTHLKPVTVKKAVKMWPGTSNTPW